MKIATPAERPLCACEVLAAEYAQIDGAAIAATDTASLAAHADEKQYAALCFSGGGIRSATFGLGVLQALAQHDLLHEFDYLSTVSGGGYLGSWLSAWIKREKGTPAQRLSTVEAALKPPSGTRKEAPQVGHLRKYSNYISPQLGLFSGDTWAVVGTYARNLLLNQLILVPLFAAALLMPRLLLGLLHAIGLVPAGGLSGPAALAIALTPASWGCLLASLVLGAFATAVLAVNLPRDKPRVRSRFLKKRQDQSSLLCYSLLPLALSAIFATLFFGSAAPALSGLSRGDQLLLFAGFGTALHLLAWLFSLLILGSLKWWDFLIVIATGALGGVLLWIPARVWFTAATPIDLALLATLGPPAFLFAFLLAATIFVGLMSTLTEDEDREFWSRSGGFAMLFVLAWVLFSALVFYGPLALIEAPKILGSLGIGTAGLTALLGHGAKTPQRKGTDDGTKTSAVADLALRYAAPIALLVLGAALSLACSYALATGFLLRAPVAASPSSSGRAVTYTLNMSKVPQLGNLAATATWKVVVPATPDTHRAAWKTHDISLHQATSLKIFLLGLLLTGISWSMSRFVDVNKFSMHAFYRNRLMRAYLGASNPEREPDPFTGFDRHDNLKMTELTGQRPLHVVNMALNLVGGKELAWQERKAESFTSTALHSGCGERYVGYRRTEDYGDPDQGISLATAMAISGAAASPNMGYHSSPTVALLMTLFNVRLGWWLGNPGDAGVVGTTKYYSLRSPKSTLNALLSEAFALTRDDYRYVYLSDGGHFENLGVYEMVRRGCRLILAVDGGQDGDFAFEDLGNAIRKVRIDFGIDIEITAKQFHPRSEDKNSPTAGKYFAVATIHYCTGDPGLLIYIKPAFYSKDTPMDIYNYAVTNQDFPHESTFTDQFFSESQFESYRALGFHAFNQIYKTAVAPAAPPPAASRTPVQFSNGRLQAFADSVFGYLP